MSAPTQSAGLAGLVADLLEQRARLEDRLAEFYRIASDLNQRQLGIAATGPLADMRSALQRFDDDLTRLANAVHAVAAQVDPLGMDAARPAIVQLMFVRSGNRQVAIRVDDVREIRGWSPAKREREWKVFSLAQVLNLEGVDASRARKLVVLNNPPGAALLVDDVTRQDELLLKPLTPGFEGPFLGLARGLDEEMVPVLDPSRLLTPQS